MPFEASEAVFLVSIRLQNSRFCLSKLVYHILREKNIFLPSLLSLALHFQPPDFQTFV